MLVAFLLDNQGESGEWRGENSYRRQWSVEKTRGPSTARGDSLCESSRSQDDKSTRDDRAVQDDKASQEHNVDVWRLRMFVEFGVGDYLLREFEHGERFECGDFFGSCLANGG